MKKKIAFICLAVSLLLVLGVNITANYSVYASGSDWRYSIFFVLGVTFISWLVGMPVGKLMKHLFRTPMAPISKLLLAMLVFATQGAVVMLSVMKGMVLIFHLREPSTDQYIANTTYCILFTLIIGLMVTGQFFLEHIKQTGEEKAAMEKEMVRSQYEALKNQVNPHFLFNSLNTLLVLIPENPALATQFVEQMSKVFRYSLQTSDDNTVDVASELKVVEAFVFLNQQRFDGKLSIIISVGEAAMKKHIITQSLLMLAENAIKHNEISTARPLQLRVYDEDDHIVLSNPLQRRTLLPSSTKIGLVNIRRRYELAGKKDMVVNETNDTFTVKLPLI